MDCSHLEEKKAPKHLRAGKGHDYFHPATACFSLTTASLSIFGSYSLPHQLGTHPVLGRGNYILGHQFHPLCPPPPTMHKASEVHRSAWGHRAWGALSKAADLHPLLGLRSPLPRWFILAPSHLSSYTLPPLHQPSQAHTNSQYCHFPLPVQKQMRQSDLWARELLPVFCAAEGFILTQHKSKHMLPYSLHPKMWFFSFALTT